VITSYNIRKGFSYKQFIKKWKD